MARSAKQLHSTFLMLHVKTKPAVITVMSFNLSSWLLIVLCQILCCAIHRDCNSNSPRVADGALKLNCCTSSISKWLHFGGKSHRFSQHTSHNSASWETKVYSNFQRHLKIFCHSPFPSHDSSQKCLETKRLLHLFLQTCAMYSELCMNL